MPSASFMRWETERVAILEELDQVCKIVGRSRSTTRPSTQRIAEAAVVLLFAQFQAFCRDLHSECADLLVPPDLSNEWKAVVKTSFVLNRKLDSSNPALSNIREDFKRFGLDLISEAQRIEPAAFPKLEGAFAKLVQYRNAVAHHDYRKIDLNIIRLDQNFAVQSRLMCSNLARLFDSIAINHIESLTNQRPGR